MAVFLFRIRPAEPDVDAWLWVVVGDLPPAHLVTDHAPNPACALKGYIELMQEWVDAVRGGRPIGDLIPVNAAPTEAWADELHARLELVKDEILTQHEADLTASE